jgi:hypothetical protein
VPLITFGHSTASAERIAELLGSADTRMLIDVRIAPGSRRHPHVARAELERWLPCDRDPCAVPPRGDGGPRPGLFGQYLGECVTHRFEPVFCAPVYLHPASLRHRPWARQPAWNRGTTAGLMRSRRWAAS